MTYPRLMVSRTAIVAGIVTLVGCGSDRAALSTAPSVASTAASIEQSVITAQDTAYVITSLVAGTSCPNLQFQISTYLIKTSAGTAYEGGSCASLRTGTKLTALNGERPNMNVMLVYATRIVIQQATTAPPPAPKPDPTPGPAPKPETPAPPKAPAPVLVPFETTVTVSSVVSTSSCPYREFMVGSYRLTTSALTRYDGGRCADIAAGATFGIVATKGSKDLSVLVSTIAFKPERDAEPKSESS